MEPEITQEETGTLVQFVVGQPSALASPIGAWGFELAPDPEVEGNVRIGLRVEGVPAPAFAPHELDALLVANGFEEAASHAARLRALLAAVWELGPRVGHTLDRHAQAEADVETGEMGVAIPVLYVT